MKWHRLYRESDEQVNLKKLLKLNGVTKLPSKMVFTRTTADWEKRHGHSGSNTIRNMCIQLDHAGWKRGDWTTGGIPDGSSVVNSRKYTSPDGKIVMSYYEHYGVTSYENSYSIRFKLVEDPVNESRDNIIEGKGRIEYEDDLVVVYSPDGKVDYEGMFDYCPYRYDRMEYDKATKSYYIFGKGGDYRTMVKVESCNESSRFGFNVGDDVELKDDVEPNRFSDRGVVPAGTVGEVVAVDKPMRGIIKVKIEDGKVVSVPERKLKLAGTDNEPWKTLASNRPPEPKRDVRPERPEDYSMRPTSYGSPRYTGD